MASIPLPALAVRPPEQQDPLAAVGRMVQLRSLLNAQQQQQALAPIQQQQQAEALKAQQLENQQRTIQMQRDKALADLFAGKKPQNASDSQAATGGDPGFSRPAPSGASGAGPGDTAPPGFGSSVSPAAVAGATAAEGAAEQANTPEAVRKFNAMNGNVGQRSQPQPTYAPPTEEEMLRAGGPAALPLIEKMADLRAKHAQLQEAQDKHQAAATDYMGAAANAIKAAKDADYPNGYSMNAARTVLQQMAGSGYENEAAQMWAQIQANPQALPQIVDRVIAQSPKQRELAAQEQTAAGRASVIPGNQAKAVQEQLALAAQTMGAATDQMTWNSRRNFLQQRGIPDDVLSQIPQQYSPEAVQQIKQMGLTPADAAKTPVEMLGMKAWLARPENQGKDAADFLQWQKTIAPAFRLQLNQGKTNDARLDRSYQYNNSELDKISAPVEQTVQRLGRLQDTLAQGTPQADALVAPELLTVMAGGQGSGLRMNEAEIARSVGGRSNWQSLQAAINKWKLDPSAANSITPAQHQQIVSLVDTVQQKLLNKAAIVDQARQGLVTAEDVTKHRQIVATAKSKLAGIDQQSGGGSSVQVTDPRGTVHTFPNQQQADAFKKAAGIP